MNDHNKSKEQLIEELHELRKKVNDLTDDNRLKRDLYTSNWHGHREQNANIDEGKTAIIQIDKLLNPKDAFDDSEDDFALAPKESKTEIIILDKLFKKQEEKTKPNQNLKAIKDFYKSILENIQNGVWVTDKKDDIFYVNKSMANIWGISRQEIMGSNIFHSLQDTVNEEFITYYRQARKTLKPINFEKMPIFQSELETYQSGWIIPIVADDEYDGMVCTVEDVTEQTFAQKLLIKLEKAIETTPVGVTITDEIGRIIFSNPADAKMHGYTVEELMGENSNIFTIPAQREETNLFNLQEYPHWKRERINIRKDGSTFPVELTSNFIRDGRSIIGLVTICEDITERKQMEKQLKKSELKYRSLVENINDVMFTLDLEGKITYINSIVKKIAGYSSKEVMGKNFTDFIHPKDLPGVNDSFKKSLRGIEEAYEFRIFCKNGTIRYVRASTRLAKKKNKPYGLTGIISDITDRKKAEIELKNSEKKLRELNATKDKFFSIIAHDLRSPLNGLILAVETLNNYFLRMDKAKQIEFIQMIKGSASDLHKLLENLLQWARTQTDKLEYYPEKIDIKKSIEENFSLLKTSADGKKITLSFKIIGSPLALADKEMINTVIRNLLSNAIKFTKNGGSVKILSKEHEDILQISVIDTGIGISSENIKKLFRIDQTYVRRGTSKEKGTGLGLVLCKEFIEKNGGKIGVKSQVDKGSIFTFTLPKIEIL